jgi:TonB-dependent receptor
VAAEEPTPPPTGTVVGVVRESEGPQTISGARIEVVGDKARTQSAADGTFRLELPSGTYTVRISADGYSSRTIPRLVVTEGKTARIEVKLGEAVKADKDSVVVNVIARLRRAAEAAQLARRQKASAVSETISAETIKKGAGSDATAAVQRATGVTIREGGGTKTVFVRGLGERYTQATLNGSRLPSPDALRRAVPLDLFPADFLEGIDIVKGYTPDLPGDFGGGLIDMRLRDFPDTLAYNVGVATGGNTETTGQDFLTNDGDGAADYFGLGGNSREWPQAVPPFSINELPPSQNFALGRQFKDDWNVEHRTAPLDWGANFGVGDSVGPLGFQLGGVYTARWRTVQNELKRQLINQGKDFTQFRGDRSAFNTRLGGILTSAYRLADGHTLFLRSFVNQASSDDTRAEHGVDTQSQQTKQARLRYVDDLLAFGQLAGEHRFDFLFVDWRSVLGVTTRNEPDTRYTTYSRPEGSDDPFTFTQGSLGGLRIRNNTRETLTDSALDLTVPFLTGLPGTEVWSGLPAKFKFGAAYNLRERNFAQRRVQFNPDGGGVDLTLPPDEIFAAKNFGPGGVNLIETTLPTDSFNGTDSVLASYGMLELPLVRDQLRLVGGVRWEDSDIQLNTFVVSTDLCKGNASVCPQSFVKQNSNFLPALNLVYNPQRDMNVRLSWSKNVSRPELRELAPTEFPAQRGDRAIQGNPDLVQFGITSYDARWEWFFSPLEIVSLGFFYKQIDQPIEKFTLYVSTEPIDTFANTGAANLYGFELEARKDMGFLRPALRALSFGANFTWAHSNVDVGNPAIAGFTAHPTSPMRPLIGQAPFIANGTIEYANPLWGTARLTYFTSGRAIDSAGSDGFPDTYEERRDRLDFVLIVPLQRWIGAPITTKLAVENILNDPILFTQGPFVQRRFAEGTSFGLSFTYSH